MRADCRRVQIFAYHLVCKSEVEPICFEMQYIEQYVGSWSFMISAKEWQLGRFSWVHGWVIRTSEKGMTVVVFF